MQPETEGRIIQIIKLKTSLKEDEALKIARERAPQFKAIPGLIQKYYVRASPPHHFAGIYIWDSMESLQAYRESELAASIPKAYKLLEAPEIEVLDVMFELR
jgi:heme-degrading monooxygenase HmoA